MSRRFNMGRDNSSRRGAETVTALFITGGILLFLGILLIMPLSLRASFSGAQARASVHYMFFRIVLFPTPKAKTGRKSDKKKPKPEKPEPEKPDAKKKIPLSDRLEKYRALLRKSKAPLNLLRRHIVLYKVRIDIRVSAEDAHATAVTYAKTAAFVGVALELLGLLVVLKKPWVRIQPDFNGEKSVYDVSLSLRIRPLFAIAAAAALLKAYLFAGRSVRKSGIRKKGGHYESTTSNR